MSLLDHLKGFFIDYQRPDNTGVILGNQPTDYFVGAPGNPIVYQERLRTGDWSPYAFDQEQQWTIKDGQYVDQMACVTHSDINSIEAQEFFLTGKKTQYSKRWIAKMSGTTRAGNYQYKVADAIRQYGLVLEDDYPTPASYTWDEFYADIPQTKLNELTYKGLEWLKKWRVQYEFLSVTDPNLDYHLKHAPLQVVVPGHAICGLYSPDQNMTYLDSYNPWIKKTGVASLLAAKKLILSQATIQARQIGWQQSPEIGIYLPADSMQRLDYIKNNLPTWLPDYNLDTSRIYPVPVKKPDFPT